ncbi:MAG: hypothetical protein AAF702_49695 [Chloroflexota bacterium]
MKQMELFPQLEAQESQSPVSPELSREEPGELPELGEFEPGECCYCGKRGEMVLTVGQCTYCCPLHRSMHLFGINGDEV